MSQQLQQPQMQQQPWMGQQQSQIIGQSFGQSVSPQVTTAVSNLERIETFAEFAKTRAVQQGLPPHVVQITDDIKNVAELQKDLLVRQSSLAGTVSQCTQQALQQGVQQLQQYQQPEIQDLVWEVQESIQTVQQAVRQLPMGGQQFGQGIGQFG